MRSSASKISASSEVGRCCVIRPHIASLVSSRSMDQPGIDPFADPELDAALEAQGPLSAQVAQRLIERGRARLDAGDHGLAIGDFQRVVGHADANLTGAALLGTGDALY